MIIIDIAFLIGFLHIVWWILHQEEFLAEINFNFLFFIGFVVMLDWVL